MPDDAARAFARSQLRLRVKRGWSQADLAREAGISPQRVSRIESHADNVRILTADAIATALDTTVDAMMHEDDLRDLTAVLAATGTGDGP